MARYIEKAEKLTLPMIPLRGIVAFPSIPVSFELVRDESIAAASAAGKADSYVFLLTQRDIGMERPSPEGMYDIGTVAKIKQSIKTPEGTVRIIVDGLCRASVMNIVKVGKYFIADVLSKTVSVDDNGGIKGEALIRETQKILEEQLKNMPALSADLGLAAKAIKNPGLYADFVASGVLVKFEDKQYILEEFDPIRRLEKLAVVMEQETDLLRIEMDIHKKVRAQLDQSQKDYYLREQLKVIQTELGEYGFNEIDEYSDNIYAANLPEEVESKLLKELAKMSKMPYASSESSVIRNYIDTCLEFPWKKTSKDRTDIAAAKKILDADHDGIEKVKERILEYIAVRQNAPELKNQTLCLVGAPGVGKTSVAASIARALKRKYVRVSLGGVRDEADIRGHRKTYIGSMPGRIAEAITKAGVRNPLILLDEIDKMSRDSHGDPASALLEVLDGEQNKSFRDHFMELPIDLSECIFIATANTLDTVPTPLIDRMEIIEMKSYTRSEKVSIAKNHLIAKQAKRHGLSLRQLKITEDAVIELINYYTREAGVRNLEREIASLCRKAARKLVESGNKRIVIDAGDIKEYLGARRVIPDRMADEDVVGEVNGLAYTGVGGDVLKIEAEILDGSGKLELTGSLGDVMKESAKAAVTYIRARTDILGIEHDFYKTKDIHIHVPEGAVPKDGPSAGVSITTALVSALSGRKVRRDVAMTGEITLRGNVLAIGGLREKSMAAYAAGIRTILIPKDNLPDVIEEVDREVRENVEFITCTKIDDVLASALSDQPSESPISLDRAADGETKEDIPVYISSAGRSADAARE
ncbi:MAG: endopeptidase La [Clostridia bacterium]|nr:endopeptidase La [Clostridia bacterium]